MLRLLLIAFGLFILALPARAQSATEDSVHTDRTPGPLEVSVERSFMRMSKGTATVAPITGYGVATRIGYRPAALSRRALFEAYGLHAPSDARSFSKAPQVSTVGLAASVLLRKPDRRINPYLMVGGGVYHVDAQEERPCRPEDGCLDESGVSFRDATLASALMDAGLYVTVIRQLAIRAGAQLYIPVRAPNRVRDSGSTRPAVSLGVTIRP